MTSRRAATVTGLTLVTVAAATHTDWVTAVCLYWAARTLTPTHHQRSQHRPVEEGHEQ